MTAATPRWSALDAARGLAVLAMILFHLIWDLAHFGYVAEGLPWTTPVKMFGHAIAFSFLFIAGVALALAHRDAIHWRDFWRRFAIIAGAAALVTIGTYVTFPSAYVFFGILHCIAAASLAAIPFLRAPWPVTAIMGALFLAAPEFLTAPIFNKDWLLWLGLSTTEPLTQDWRPFLPWAGALLLGVAAGKYFRAPVASSRWQSPRALNFLGRHSLIIYLAHQPLLFAFFTALVFVAPPQESAESFVASCETRCIANGGVSAFCREACLCTVREAIRTNTLAGSRYDAERSRRLSAIANRCAEF